MFDKLQFVVTSQNQSSRTSDKLKFVGQSLHRIVTASTEGLTPKEAPNGHPHSFDGSVSFNCFARIFRTGRCKAAGRRQPWRDYCLVEFQKRNQNETHRLKAN